MRLRVVIFFLFPLGLFAQSAYYLIDDKVNNIPVSDIKTVAEQLSTLGKTDREKARAIFRWITLNIDYNVRPVTQRKNNFGLFYDEQEDSAAALPTLTERVAKKVLNKGVAFCEGYAHLFKALCDHAGIRAEIIYGYGRTNTSKRFAVNHAWNAVYIDSAWQLLDVTWASGVVSYSNVYIRMYNDFYFLTPPEQFIHDHYPEDLQWSLMDNPPVYREFNQSPFRYPGYLKSGITTYFPGKGVMNVAIGDTIVIQLKTKKEVRNVFASQRPVVDSVQSFFPSYFVNGENITLKYTITEPASEWLYIFCNDELAMKYKLNIKKDITASNLPRVNK